MKVLSIIGARPQFIKEAMIQKEIIKHKNIEEVVVHTGQHYDRNMSEIFFDTLNLKAPKYNLEIHNTTHGEMTGRMIIELEKIICKELPDIVLLYGDTNSTLAGAIAASKLNVMIAHVEAGIRQFPKTIPEEINRCLVDRVSNIHFCPSELELKNLVNEGLGKGNILISGDVMYDLFIYMKNKFDYSIIDDLNLRENDYIVVTLHRDFNVDNIEVLKSILEQLNKLSYELKIVFPIHPRTKKRIKQFNLESYLNNILVLNPLNYLQLMGLTEKCFKVITDSGGYQKEAYFCKKHACVLMPDSGWKILVDYKWNTLCDASNLIQSIFIKNKETLNNNVYGNGDASARIINFLLKTY